MRYAVLAFVMFLQLTTPSVSATTYTIQDAYNAAMGNNEAVKIAEEDVFQASAREDQASTYLYPRVTAQGGYTRYNAVLPPGGGAVFQPLDQTQGAVILTQPLYTGGRTMAAWRIAKTLSKTSEDRLAVTRENVLLNVADAYYSVIKAQKIVETNQHALDRMEHHREVTEREASTRRTKANTSALLRANTLVNQARITLVRAEDGLKIAREKLNFLTGLPPDLTAADPDAVAPPAGDAATLQETALKNREDYLAARMNEQVAREYVTVTKGGHYPQVYAEGGVTYTRSSPETLLDGTTYYGGVRVQIPIFEGGLMNAEVSEAQSKVRQAELASTLLMREIKSEVFEAYINYQTLQSVVDTARRQLDDAQKNFTAIEGLFAEGLVPSLSLIDAEQALSAAESQYVVAVWDGQLAIVRLNKSIGLLGKKT